MKQVKLTRTQATKILEDVRELSARFRGKGFYYADIAKRYEEIFNRVNPEITPLEQCEGEAHSNAFIDNCMCCAPRWGLLGPFIKIT